MEKQVSLEKLGKEIIQDLYREGMIRTWYRDKPDGFTLASGMYSPFYINLRLISSVPSGSIELYRKAGEAVGLMLKNAGFVADGIHRIVGVAMAGIPLANAVTLNMGIPSLYTRKLPEDVKTPEDVEEYIRAHGQKALVEGDFESGDRLAIVDDLVTTFGSKALAISQVEQEAKQRGITDLTIKDIVVLIDREQGGAQKAAELGYNLHALIPFASKGLDWLQDSLHPIEYETISSYLQNPEAYQDKEVQTGLTDIAKERYLRR
jgi:uridine monophosphate synthetase